MQITEEKLVELRERFASEHVKPPWPVLHAVAAVIGERTVVASITHYQPAEPGTKWECMALTPTCLATVTASRPGGDWYLERYDDDDAVDADIIASLIPLSEVTACRLLELRSIGVTEWLGRWEICLRDGGILTIPYPNHRPGHRSHDDFAAALAAKIN